MNFTFLGQKTSFKKARVVILPILFDGTTSYRPGARFGPEAIISASRQLELFDSEMKKDISQIGIHTLPSLEPNVNSVGEMIEEIKTATRRLLKTKKFIFILGGDHSISYGTISAFKERYRHFSVLQLDAHTDLRDQYQGSEFSHDCPMRRIHELGIPLVQVGIRSMSQEEWEYLQKSSHFHAIKHESDQLKHDKTGINTFFAPELPIEKIINCLEKNVYLTFDLDALDPSIMPSVGTPEPGGLGWYEVLRLLKEVTKKRKIIGADLVELMPIPGFIAPDFLAAKLVFKIMGYVFGR